MAQKHDIDEILSTVRDETFVKEDWNCVFRECKKLSAHWHDLCAFLGMDPDDLERIMRDNGSDSKACLKKSLYEWIKQNYPTPKYGLPSWRTLLEAVAEVDKHLFKKLAEKYKATSSGSSASKTEVEASIKQSEQQCSSQDAEEKTHPKHSECNVQAEGNQNTLNSELQPEEALRNSQSSVPHNNMIMESSTNTAGKSTPLKKGASQGSSDSFHLRVSRSEASKHSRKLVRSFPESPSEVPLEEKSLGISTCSAFLQRLSPDDTTDSYTQPDYRRSCFQLYVPTSAEFYAKPVYSSSSDQLLSIPESFTHGDRCRSSDELYRPTNVYYADSSTHLDHSRSSGQLDKSTSIADSVIDFLLKFDQSRLKVRLTKATNLPKEFHAHCDPFVVLHLEPSREETFKSRVVRGTRDPEFRQTFQFERMSLESIKLQTLVLRIYNHAFHNKAIGKVYLPISEIQLSGSRMQMNITRTEESNYYQGDLLLSLEYNPVLHTLAGLISRATCLPKCDMFGKSDPYVKVIISHNDTKVYKYKTSVKNKTLSPVYNETFSYDIPEGTSMEKVTVSFFVIDHDVGKWNDVIGVVNVGRKVASKLGREHWDQVLQHPGKEVSFWHPVQLATSAEKRRMRSRSPSPAPR